MFKLVAAVATIQLLLVFGFFLVCGEACFVGVGFSPRHQEPTLAANTKHESGIYVCAR